MSPKTAVRLRFTLSGPGIDKSYETAGAAISAAITHAEKLRQDKTAEATFYVRDVTGEVVGVVKTEKGRTFIDERAEFIGSGRVA